MFSPLSEFILTGAIFNLGICQTDRLLVPVLQQRLIIRSVIRIPE